MSKIPMGDLLRHHAERLPPDALAVAYPDGSATWWELERLANQRARRLRELGVRAGDMVTVAVPNSRRFFEITFALWKLGATPNVISYRLPRRELQAIVDLARPRLVIAAEAQPVDGFPVTPMDVDVSDCSPEALPAVVGDHWRALTSGGSTGRPKLIVDHTAAAYDPDNAQFLQQPGWRALSPGPLYHSSPFATSHLALFIGCSVIGMSRFDPEEALALIERHRINWTCMVPTMMHRIWSLPPTVRERYDISSLQVVVHVASKIAPWLKRAWIDWLGAEKIYEVYGGTENQGLTWITGPEWLERPGSVGRIQGQAKLKVVRPDGTECEPGEIGEVFLRPADPEAPPYHYVGAEARRLDGGWETLGDIGWVDAEGYLFLADRRTDLILRGGANIYPAEVEAALDAHPAVASSIVLGLPDEDLGHRVHAIVEPRAGAEFELTGLHAFLEARLVRYKLPETYEIATGPLRDDAGKARRTALRDERIGWLEDGREFRLSPGAAIPAPA